MFDVPKYGNERPCVRDVSQAVSARLPGPRWKYTQREGVSQCVCVCACMRKNGFFERIVGRADKGRVNDAEIDGAALLK
jgi:hypothetical protein